MLTATRARAQQFFSPVADLSTLTAMAIVGVGALVSSCYQAPAGSSVTDMSSSPAGLGQGASQTPTQITPTTSTGAQTGNSTVQMPDISVGTMTISSVANPFLCLGAKDVSLGAPLTVATCDQSAGQRWLWQDMRLKASETLCLAFPASGTAALKTTPILATCNVQDQSQLVMRGSSAGLVAHTNGASYGLAVPNVVASNAMVTFENLDPNQVGQKWVLGSDNASSGSLLTGGLRIAAQNGNTLQCLTANAGDANLTYAPCTSNNGAYQSFRWTDTGALTHNESCLTSAGVGPVSLKACNSNDKNQGWYSITGFLQAASAAGSLQTTQATVGPSPAAGVPQMILGLPAQK